MDGSGALVLCWKIFVLVGFTLVGYGAGNNLQTTSRQEPQKPISCYQCNSEYDPRCGESFDNYTIGVVQCSLRKRLEHLPNLGPVLCRKTIQKVQGKTRVIRGCGYIRDDRDDKECYLRTGTKDVQVIYCSCTKDKCNEGTEPSAVPALVTLLAAWIAKLMA